MPKKKLIGWIIIIAAVIVSFCIMIFVRKAFDIMTVIIAGATILGYSIATTAANEKKK